MKVEVGQKSICGNCRANGVIEKTYSVWRADWAGYQNIAEARCGNGHNGIFSTLNKVPYYERKYEQTTI